MIMHAIFFNPTLFLKSLPGKLNKYVIQSNNNFILKGPHITEQTRNYFNCPSAIGAPLENYNNPQTYPSHFKKFIFGDETMTLLNNSEVKISKFSLAVAKDLGWFEVDLTTAHSYTWAMNSGCGVLEGTCDPKTVKDFCSVDGKYDCSDDHVYITKCHKSVSFGNCLVKSKITNCREPGPTDLKVYIRGPSSVCLNQIENNERSAGCFQIQCSKNFLSYDIIKIEKGTDIEN